MIMLDSLITYTYVEIEGMLDRLVIAIHRSDIELDVFQHIYMQDYIIIDLSEKKENVKIDRDCIEIRVMEILCQLRERMKKEYMSSVYIESLLESWKGLICEALTNYVKGNKDINKKEKLDDDLTQVDDDETWYPCEEVVDSVVYDLI